MSSKQQQRDAKDGALWSCFFNYIIMYIINPNFEQANFLKVKSRWMYERYVNNMYNPFSDLVQDVFSFQLKKNEKHIRVAS